MINQNYNTYYSQLETNSGQINVIVSRIKTLLESTALWTNIESNVDFTFAKEAEFANVLERIENLLDIHEFDWTEDDTDDLKALARAISNYYQSQALECYYRDDFDNVRLNTQYANTALYCGNLGDWLETLGNLLKTRDAILDDLTRARKQLEEDIERNSNKKMIRAKLEEALKDVQCTNKESIILGALNSF